MNAEPSVVRNWLPIVLGLSLVYGLAHLCWYWQTPLGQVAVLDEAENLGLARQIAEGALPHEPFYRAMLYPFFLSILFLIGLKGSAVVMAATGAGLLLHLFNTALAGIISRDLFRSSKAALLTAFFYGLNPVLIHYATQILDATLSNSFLLAGLLFLVRSRKDSSWLIAASLCWATATLVRPQNLLVWLGLPFCAWLILAGRDIPSRVRSILVALLFGGLLFVVQGLVQQMISGKFRMIPTQGTYNLWAANKPGAHGRYFVQTIHVDPSQKNRNPTQVETEILYEQETGKYSHDPDELNRYWSEKLKSELRADPLGFIERALTRVYYLLNDAEQYNNKTFGFHKSRSPLLCFNPIGWGILLLLGLAGWVMLFRSDRPGALTLLIVFSILSLSIVVAFVSARFRLPLAAILCILTGGIIPTVESWKTIGRRQWITLSLLLALAAGLTFSNFRNARSNETHVQDHLLLARASVQTGEDLEAWKEAGIVLSTQPENVDALAWRISSYFNLFITGSRNLPSSSDWSTAAEQWLSRDRPENRQVTAIAALALWRAGERARATDIWRGLISQGDAAESLAALYLTGEATPDETQQLSQASGGGPLLRLARSKLAPTEAGAELRRAAERIGRSME